jgi:hypothetical protein
LRGYLDAHGVTEGAGELPRPSEVLLDPYYLTGEDHQPALGWLFGATGDASTTPGSGIYVVSQQTIRSPCPARHRAPGHDGGRLPGRQSREVAGAGRAWTR